MCVKELITLQKLRKLKENDNIKTENTVALKITNKINRFFFQEILNIFQSF